MVEEAMRPSRSTKLTSHDGCSSDEDWSWDDKKNEKQPVGHVVNAAPNQGRNIKPTNCEGVGEDDLDDGDGEDDHGRSDLLTLLLSGCEGCDSVDGTFCCQATHDFKESDVEGRMQGEEDVCLKIAPAITSIPGFDIIVPPYEGIDDGEEVESHG